MHAHNEQMFREWMAQLQAEQDHRQRQLEEAIDREELEAKELWDRVERCRERIPHHDGGGRAGWATGDAANQKLGELAQQMSAVMELAQSQASEEVQQKLAELSVQMQDLEDDMGNGGVDDYAEDDWFEEHQQDHDPPPWRRGDDGSGANHWRTAQNRAQPRARGSADDTKMGDGPSDDGDRGLRTSDPGTADKGGARGGGAKTASSTKEGAAKARGPPKAETGRVGPQPSAAQQAADAAVLQAQRAAAEAAAAAATAEATAKRQRAIDKIRGRLQAERERDLEAKQREAGISTLESAQSWTEEQLDQHTKQLEEFDRCSEHEAERLYAQMPEEERANLIEAASM